MSVLPKLRSRAARVAIEHQVLMMCSESSSDVHLYPRKRTLALHNSMSANGQNLSSCVAHITLKRADRE